MIPASTPHPNDAAHRAQRVFRATMRAMARPGRIETVAPLASGPDGLDPTLAALVLTLADYETPVWLDARLAADRDVAEFIRFHSGAPIATDARRAAFALVASPEAMPPLAAFAQGEPEYPDRSTTLFVKVEQLSGDGLRLRGPGISGEARLGVAPFPARLLAELSENRSCFPLGVDLILVENGRIAALPRSTIVSGEVTCTLR